MHEYRCTGDIIESQDGDYFVFLDDAEKKGDKWIVKRAIQTKRDQCSELMAEIAENATKNKICMLKFAYWNDYNNEDLNVFHPIYYLKKEALFHMYYPFIEEVYGEFEGRDSKGRKLYGVYVEYLEGKNLRNYCEKKDNDQEWTDEEIADKLKSDEELAVMFRYMLQLLKGVRYYVQNCTLDSYIHRDLKPENIMILDKEKRLVIIDFDWAHIPESSETERIFNKRGYPIWGTKGYMDPRAASQGTSDIQMDIYALGRIFCFWIRGEHYFRHHERDVYWMEDKEELAYGFEWKRIPKQFRKEEFAQFCAIIKKMVAPFEERYSSIDSIITDMIAFLRYYYREDGNTLHEILENEQLLTTTDQDKQQESPPYINITYKKRNRGVNLQNYRMYEVAFEKEPIMMIYNLDNKIYYIPYHDDLRLVKQSQKAREEFEILGGDIFEYQGENIEIRIS